MAIVNTVAVENNHHSKLSEIKLNGSLTTMELKKPYPSRLVGGVQMQNRPVPQPHVVDKNLGRIYREQGVPAPHQDPWSRVPVPERLSPHNFWLQNPAGIESGQETAAT